MTACMRLPGTTNMSLRKQAYTMNPYPDVHFYIPGYAPLNARGAQGYRTFSLEDTMLQIFEEKTYMSSVDLRVGRFITTETILRGNISELMLEDMMIHLQERNKEKFVPWMDCHSSYGVCSIAPSGTKIAATYLANHTGITRMWRKILEAFRRMFKRKTFTSWYYAAGLSDQEFEAAEEEFMSIIDKYEFLEKLEGQGGCVTELGEEDPCCNDQSTCTEPVTNCGRDGVLVNGELGPVCIDRNLLYDSSCGCADKIEVSYALDPPSTSTS